MNGKILITITIFLITKFCYAQSGFTVYNDGMPLVILETGLIATIDGNFVSQTNGSDGQINNQSTIRITGNWNNNNASSNVFSASAGTVQLIGSNNQTLGGTTTSDFNNLVINNSTSGTGITLSEIIDISGSLTFTDGLVSTSSSNYLNLKDGATSNGGSSNSYVMGPMRKTGTSAFTFILGDGTTYARLGIGAPTSSSTFEAEYFASPYSDISNMASSPTPVLNNVSVFEYWNISRISGTGDVKLTLYWESASASGIDDCTDLRIAHYNGAWENNHDGTTSVIGSCSGSGSGSISTTDNVTTFSSFTFGSVSSLSNPLPIVLLDFSALMLENSVLISWSTASESNNDFFTLERSRDGLNFEMIAEVDGAGNSNEVLNYSVVDEDPFFGISYYRLKQTDYDGMYDFSNLVAINNTNLPYINIYPNPLEGNTVNISILDTNEEELVFKLYNPVGKMVFMERMYTRNMQRANGLLLSRLQIPSNLQTGIYHIVCHSNSEHFRNKLVIK